MRELRFRVWDSCKKRWMLFIEPIDEFEECEISPEPAFNSLIIEQYTGLKDRNGKEVYEGDILMDDCSDPLEYWTVKHEYGKFVGEAQGVVEDVYELTDLEVIGNVHENPELLKGKDENQSY